METFSALLALCAGNSPVPGEFPTQRPVTRSFHVLFDNREAGDLRRYHGHYDVIITKKLCVLLPQCASSVQTFFLCEFPDNFDISI